MGARGIVSGSLGICKTCYMGQVIPGLANGGYVCMLLTWCLKAVLPHKLFSLGQLVVQLLVWLRLACSEHRKASITMVLVLSLLSCQVFMSGTPGSEGSSDAGPGFRDVLSGFTRALLTEGQYCVNET